MKFALYSDLHIEFPANRTWAPPALDVDVVILAGDIGLHTQGLAWAQKMFCRGEKPPSVIYVAGNHEYYRTHLGLLDELRDPKWTQAGVTFLECARLDFPGVRVLGCTLWSDFALYGPEAAAISMATANSSINDYRLIEARGGFDLHPRDTAYICSKSVTWLEAELAKPYDGKTVVVTHFAPHPDCVAPQYEGGVLSPYFVSDLSDMMHKHKIDVWCFGHTHTNCDFLDASGCRVLSNQRGYPAEVQAGNGFLEKLVFVV